MLTRPTRRNQINLRDRFRSHLWRLTAAAFASSVAATTLTPHVMAADGIILEAPANQRVDTPPVDKEAVQAPSTPTDQSTAIDGGWSKRGSSAPKTSERVKSEASSQSDSSQPAATIAALPKSAPKASAPVDGASGNGEPAAEAAIGNADASSGMKTPPGKRTPVPARPAAGPIDGFKARTQLPSAKIAEQDSPALEFAAPVRERQSAGDMATQEDDAGRDMRDDTPLKTPGAMALEELRSVPPPVSGNWRGRGTSVGDQPVRSSAPRQPRRGSDQTATDRQTTPPPVNTGGWIAREAINRIEPLRDPVPQHQAPIKPVQRPATKPTPTSPQSAPAANANRPSESPTAKAASPDVPNVREEVSPIAKPNTPSSVQRRQSPEASDLKHTTESMEPSLDELPTEADLPLDSSKVDSKQRSMSLDEAARDSKRSKRDQKEAMAEKLLDSIDSAAIAEKESQPKQPSESIATKNSSPSKLREFEGDASALQPLPKGELEDSPKSKSTEPARKLGGATSSVGDLPPQDNDDSIDQPELDVPSEVELDYTGRPASEIKPNRTVANMRVPIERVLRYFYQRPEIASGRSNWGMMHQLIVFGTDTQIRVGNRRYSAIAWIAGNNICRGQRLLTNDADGIKAKNGVGLQGHDSQFLAVLGMCNVPVEYPLYAGKMKYTVDALIESEQRGCKEDHELTFTLMGLAHYLDTDSTWMADDGTQWDFERLIAEELDQQIVGAACGGTHRLMGYAHALRKRRAEGKPIDGHWKRAEIYTNDFIDYAYSLQNRDGSMSTNWFEGRADNGDVDRKVQTTGHIVEWLLTVTPDDQLQDRRLVAAVNFLLRAMASDLDHDWSIGPKGHALRSLAMYHQRVFRSGTPWVPQQTASAPSQRSRR